MRGLGIDLNPTPDARVKLTLGYSTLHYIPTNQDDNLILNTLTN